MSTERGWGEADEMPTNIGNKEQVTNLESSHVLLSHVTRGEEVPCGRCLVICPNLVGQCQWEVSGDAPVWQPLGEKGGTFGGVGHHRKMENRQSSSFCRAGVFIFIRTFFWNSFFLPCPFFPEIKPTHTHHSAQVVGTGEPSATPTWSCQGAHSSWEGRRVAVWNKSFDQE